MKLFQYINEGLLYLLIVITLFNLLTEFLEITRVFIEEDIKYIGIISILLGLDNMLTNKFFGYRLF